MKFVLLHGAWHGGWCWERLTKALNERGHEAIAPDLPSDDPQAGLAEYAAAVPGGDVVIVAHSMAGMVAPLVPARAIVYLAALIPLAGVTMNEQQRTDRMLTFKGGRERDELGRSYWTDPAILYADLDPEGVPAAARRLRPQADTPFDEPHPGGLPDTPATSIVCTRDAVVSPEWSRRVARERLGVEPLELPYGHFPMLTAPDALAEALTTGRPPTGR